MGKHFPCPKADDNMQQKTHYSTQPRKNPASSSQARWIVDKKEEPAKDPRIQFLQSIPSLKGTLHIQVLTAHRYIQ